MKRSLTDIKALLLAKLRHSPRVASLALGLFSGLAMPPIDAWWVFAIGFPLFFLVVEGATLKRSFLLGWLFGFGYFLAVLHWVGFAFFVDAASYLWMMPFAVAALAGGMAQFWATAILATQFLVLRGAKVYFAMPFCFGCFEWLRGHVLTGFPWAVPGLAVDGMGGVAQLASIVGMNGLTVLVVLWAMIPIAFFRNERGFAALALASLIVVWGWGEWRIAAHPTGFVAGVGLRIVQPNISQSDKWRASNARKIFDQLLDLTSAPAASGFTVTHVIWPESSMPFLIDESVEGKSEIAGALGDTKTLLAGAVRRSAPTDDADYFTSVLVFDSKANVVGQYDKSHLVPGGEFLPLAWLIEPLGFRKVVNIPESFKAGAGPESVAVPGAGFAGLQICYEAIFPDLAVDVNHRPSWLVNVTNDGWFGNSAGPWQHLAQLRLRAIEQGLPVARSANTGISSVIDPVGRYILHSKLGVAGFFDVGLPVELPTTFYATWGDFALAGLLFAIVLGQLLIWKKKVNRSLLNGGVKLHQQE